MASLAYVMAEGRGAGDLLLADLADRLGAQGYRLAGVVQHNIENITAARCDMDLSVLGTSGCVRISQRLGALAQGCRLDPDGLERAVGQVEARLAEGVDLLILNKFGKTEAEGRGFRDTIGRALAAEVPVILAVKPDNLAAFEEFHGGFAERLQPRPEALDAWVQACLAPPRS